MTALKRSAASAPSPADADGAAPQKRGIAPLYLGVIMAAMGVLQLVSWGSFVDAIESYDAGFLTAAGAGASTLAAAIIIGELVAAVGLFTQRRVGPLVSVIVMVVWSALAVQAFARGLSLDNCGCFGRFWAQKLRWWILLEDGYLLVLSGWLLARSAPKAPSQKV